MSVEMKDSGIAWIGEIPKHWGVEKIKRLLRNKSIKNKANEQVLSLYRDYGIVPKNSRDDNHNVTSEDTSTYKFVEDGDFVVNKMKAWQGSMAVSSFQGIISPAYHVFSFLNTEIDKMYIHYLLRDESYKPEYMRLSTGLRVGQWDLSVDDFLNIHFVLPPKEEQSRIANFLDKKCAEIDELIALQEQMIAQLTTYKQAVITETVTKGLDPNVKMKDSGVEWIGEIPEHWDVCKLKNYCSDRREKATGNNKYIGLENVESYSGRYVETDSKYDTEQAIICRPNDVIFGKLRPYLAKTLVIAELCCCSSEFVVFSQIPDANYLKHVLLSDYFVKIVDSSTFGTKMPRADVGFIKNMIIATPPLSEQQCIANYLNQKCKEIDELISVKKEKIEKLKAYKKSVIYEYVTGKKQVN